MNSLRDWRDAKAAIFDVDGTLVSKPSVEMRFARRLLSEGKLRVVPLARQSFEWLKAHFAEVQTAKGNKSYLEGVKVVDFESRIQDFTSEIIEKHLCSEALDRLVHHQQLGARCCLITGTLHGLAHELGSRLGIHEVYASVPEQDNGAFTGRLSGPHPYGEIKVELLNSFCQTGGCEPSDVAAYADDYSDRHLLQLTGWPTAVSPDLQLRSLAESEGWEIVH